jgi:tRNA(Ile)-lysidine synthase
LDPLHEYLARVRRFSQEERLFRRVTRVLVATSGGADSLATLLLLQRLGPEQPGFEVVACHFDHKLRAESGDEQRRVREMVEEMGVSCVTGEGDVAAMAADLRLGLEEGARRMRYQFLAFAAGKERADVVATGHTADDQAETVLHHIVRGSGVRGMRGMLPRSSVPGAAAQVLVRPVLCLARADTEEICRMANLEPVVDPSNLGLLQTRNRIRHKVLPVLEQLNPSVRGALVRLAESAREVFEDVERAARTTQPVGRSEIGAVFALDALRELQPEALALVLEREAGGQKLAFEVNRTRLRNLTLAIQGGTGKVQFGEAVAEVSAGQLRVGPELPPGAVIEPVVLNVPGSTRAGDYRVDAATEEQPGWTPLAAPRGVLRVRSARHGDRLRRADRDVRLTRALVDARLPGWDRRDLLVVADGDVVVALPGVAARLVAPPPEPELWVRATRLSQDLGVHAR